LRERERERERDNERERKREIAFKSPLFDAHKNGPQISFDRIIGGS
jgi:hypothetical protein